MTNEARLVDRMSIPVNFACVDGLGMEKGTILVFSGPRGVKPSATNGDVVVGVLHREKIANDGRTQVAVFLDGIFDCSIQAGAGSISVGSHVGISGPNILKVFTAGDSEDGTVFGKLLEAATAGDEVLQVLVGRGP